MKHKPVLLVATLCLALTFLSGSLLAQDVNNNRIGTAGAAELLIPVGARDMAMGGATIATSMGVQSLHWNPAGLGRMDVSAEGMFTSMAYIADIRVNYGAVGINFGGFGKVALNIKALSFGDIPLTTVDDPENFAGRTFSPSFFTLGLSWARAFTDAITAGGTIKLINEDMKRVKGSGFAIDLGVQYHGVAGFKGLHLGVALKNIGPQLSFDGSALLREAQAVDGRRPTQFYQSQAASFELPSSVEFGLAYSANVNENLSWNVNTAYANNNLALDSYKFGGELVYKMGNVALAARGGMDLEDKGSDDESIFGPTFGFGLHYKAGSSDIAIDYAYRSVDFFDNNNMFSIRVGF